VKTSILLAGILASAALPLMAQAQPEGCVQTNHDNRVAGTVVGAIAGAVIGGAIGGHAQRGAGVAIGAVTGGVAGNAIARSNQQPCPEGYVYEGQPPREDSYYRHGDDRLIYQRIESTQSRLDNEVQNGSLSEWQGRRFEGELQDIRDQDEQLRERDGGRLDRADRNYLENRLDDLNQRIRYTASY
jgi:phage tail tape-measure protein